MYTEIRFTLNGEQKLYQGDPLRRLLDVLREDYGLTGSKEGCGEDGRTGFLADTQRLLKRFGNEALYLFHKAAPFFAASRMHSTIRS